MSLEDWLLVPHVRLGEILFATPIDLYLDIFDMYLSDEKDDVTGLESYTIRGEDVDIYVENGMVFSVTANRQLFFRGVNLIGLSQDDLIEILKTEPDEIGISVIYESGEIQTPLDFDQLGLEIWIADDVVVSGCCSNLLLE